MYKLSLWILFSLFLNGCAAGTLALKETNIDDKIAKNPHIKQISKKEYPQLSKDKEVVLYYREWTTFNKPDAVINWRKIYQIERGSAPDKAVEKLASTIYYSREINDTFVLQKLQDIARQKGGDILMDLYRTPALDTISTPSKIIGYRYHGIIARNKE